ncbi:MAG: cell division FtsA domain-containing protein [Clostridia bacterium]|nr:cell division FtsA domain-containing protein [Clostridia bacterium]
MSKNIASVLEIGSSKISILIGSEGTNHTFVIYGKSDVDYSGFSNSEFFEEEKIDDIIGKAIENVELATKFTVKELTVGVPVEFCISTTKKVNITFVSRRKLTKNLIQEIYESAFEDIADYTLVGIQPIYNILDDGKRLIEVENQKTSKISSFLNLIYIKTSFIEMFNKKLSNLGIVKVNYVCSALAETQYLLCQDELATNAMIIDIGYLTTSVAVAKGGGLLNLYSFSLGGGHIMGDLSECLNINVKEAEELKRQIVLSLKPSANDFYEIHSMGKTKQIFTKLANEIVSDRLDMFCSCINTCLKESQSDEYMPIYLTGGGVSYMKGAKDFISKKIGHNVGLISPPLAEFNKPHLSSLISLLAHSLKDKTKNNYGIVANALK